MNLKTTKPRIQSVATLVTLTFLLAACGATPEVAVTTTAEPKYPVTTALASVQVSTTVLATGSVESKGSTVVYPSAAGVVSQLFVRDGSRVSRGTPLYRIGGVNGTAHPLEVQMKTAYAQAVAAVNAYNTTIQANQLALSGAYLGYYSSLNQTQASLLDQRVFDENRNGINTNLDSLNAQLQAAQTQAQQDQLRAQIAQAMTQRQVLDLNQQSIGYKLGLSPDQGSFGQMQSELQIPTTITRNQGSLTQAKMQVEQAKNQYELAKTQYEGLTVKAQSSGVVTGMDLSVGSPVNPQAPSATIINSSVLTADVGVSEDESYLITNKTKVEIKVGPDAIASKILSISPQVDPLSKKVMITIAIPANTIRVNGTVLARFYVDAKNVSKGPRVFVPLDAVIVSTEETFVFIVVDGKAVKRTVTRGEVAHDQVEITEGISPGDVVIIEGAKDVFDGQPVTDSAHPELDIDMSTESATAPAVQE